MGQNRNTAWQNTCGALPVQFQQCHPCEWQDWDGFQAKQNYRNVKATIRFSQIIPNTNLHHLEKTGRYLQLPSFTSFALHDLYSCSCAKVVILTQLTFAVEMWDSYQLPFAVNGPKKKHSLAEHLCHVASTTSSVASLQVARLRWLPSQAKLPLHDGWRRTWQMCQWQWNVKSTIRKARSSSTQTWIALEKLLATYNFPASPFLHYMISTQHHCRPC